MVIETITQYKRNDKTGDEDSAWEVYRGKNKSTEIDGIFLSDYVYNYKSFNTGRIGFYIIGEEKKEQIQTRNFGRKVSTIVLYTLAGNFIRMIDFRKYFNEFQTLNKGDIVKRGNTLYSIKYFYLDRGAVCIKAESLLSGTEEVIIKNKILPKMKVYKLNDRQKEEIQRQKEELEKKLKELAKSALAERSEKIMKPRTRLGIENLFVVKEE